MACASACETISFIILALHMYPTMIQVDCESHCFKHYLVKLLCVEPLQSSDASTLTVYPCSLFLICNMGWWW